VNVLQNLQVHGSDKGQVQFGYAPEMHGGNRAAYQL
jgi:hypothetical protein